MEPEQIKKDIKSLILLALREDISDGDITSNAVFQGNETSKALVIAKENGIFCCGEVVESVYYEIDPGLEISIKKKDGTQCHKGETVIEIIGDTKNILIGERTILNFIGRMSGIATKTRRTCSLLNGTRVKLLDTRKTLPGFRLLDKYSVRMGGGQNHRFGLYDMVMIKDNHIKAAGGIREAVNRVKETYGGKFEIEVETKNLKEVREAVKSEVDIIMLDNMNSDMMKKAIDIIEETARIEASGNMSEERIREISGLKIDYISMGALTHSVKSMDFSMRLK